MVFRERAWGGQGNGVSKGPPGREVFRVFKELSQSGWSSEKGIKRAEVSLRSALYTVFRAVDSTL